MNKEKQNINLTSYQKLGVKVKKKLIKERTLEKGTQIVKDKDIIEESIIKVRRSHIQIIKV